MGMVDTKGERMFEKIRDGGSRWNPNQNLELVADVLW